jgi:NAD-dependent SIR2 family protein deacetylase
MVQANQAIEAKVSEKWCDRDGHSVFEFFEDFNTWLDSSDGQILREEYKVNGLSQPSKALFAGDKNSYDVAFSKYRAQRRNDVLSKDYLREQFSDDHWFERNLSRFDQLVEKMRDGDVVPFIGAGLSVGGGFPSWYNHLKQQAKTAGIAEQDIEELLNQGLYEEVLERIENQRGRDVFIQEIQDVFSVTGEITDTSLILSDLFRDTIITTNYDRLIEKAFDTGVENPYQIISGNNVLEKPDPHCVTIIKLHGDIKTPARCILSKNQYDQAYGNHEINLALPIPKLLDYHYRNSNLLFLGSSLNNDRTVQVFKTIKEKYAEEYDGPRHFSIEQVPEDLVGLRDRNEYLARIGIKAIWFEKGQYDTIEAVLRLARAEIRYKNAG